MANKKIYLILVIIMLSVIMPPNSYTQTNQNSFRVIAFYTSKEDLAHISFVHEANRWFPQMAAIHNLTFI